MPDSNSIARDVAASADFRREMLIAVVMGLATLASGWSSYQSALWEGIQTFRLSDLHALGRDVSVKEVSLGQQHLLDLFMLERFLDAREVGDNSRSNFLFGRLSPELQAATKTWLDTRPKENPDAARSPFHIKGYVQAGRDEVDQLRKKAAAIYADADSANKISDNYVRITVYFGLAMFLTGITAVMKSAWPRRGLLAGSVVILMGALVLLAQMPLATE